MWRLHLIVVTFGGHEGTKLSLTSSGLSLFSAGCCSSTSLLSGSCPFVSYNRVKMSQKHWMFLKSNKVKSENETTPSTLQSLSAGADEGGLFLGRPDQRLVGNAESTHVDRPNGEAPFVPRSGRCCNMLRILICDKLATSMLCQYTELGESRQWAYGECFYLACSTESSRSGVGAFPRDFIKALRLTRIHMLN